MFSPIFDAVRPTSNSPSPPASFCIALGAKAMGRDVVQSKIEVVVSMLLTSLSTLGRMYILNLSSAWKPLQAG